MERQLSKNSGSQVIVKKPSLEAVVRTNLFSKQFLNSQNVIERNNINNLKKQVKKRFENNL